MLKYAFFVEALLSARLYKNVLTSFTLDAVLESEIEWDLNMHRPLCYRDSLLFDTSYWNITLYVIRKVTRSFK